MSVPITIRNITKRYGDTVVIPDLSADIHDGEFFTLLGPSGCGKTTLLRMIAGFIDIERGTIAFGDQVINDVPVYKRDYGMVFQNYAIFPSMTVEKNVMFGLENRKVPKTDAERRTLEMLAKVKMEHLAKRFPENLSGGQQQRIALARAIVINPQVLLMDEPLSNLDAKLRIEIRQAIADIQREIGITTVYVTHDQEEALSVSDRIAVMNAGEIQQIASPEAIYRRPFNQFVAGFVGHSNSFDATVLENAGGRGGLRLAGGYTLALDTLRADVAAGDEVVVSVRPENFVVADSPTGLSGTVRLRQFLGAHVQYILDDPHGREFLVNQSADFGTRLFEIGDSIDLGLDARAVNVFDGSGRTLIEGVTSNVVGNDRAAAAS
ncbi:ABC transporter ATP-binding protein [Propioniciclava coleopterorum]|uniref:ABC transporter ATP-binding protein n=1 Tax=Propioniciclava coleopterorum TaxID=2714937 RepID=A0A6G7Y7Z5_9ACTN|nr:ABC transporter ATP-binding protein [Propioniciclava coleopterorum]QIK72751.1 ABC transporter ATP-binding protein [Propioniciclava coleopterorum]